MTLKDDLSKLESDFSLQTIHQRANNGVYTSYFYSDSEPFFHTPWSEAIQAENKGYK